ncbi:MAG: twin-arginine translocase subunit TatC [Planctomycetota bacterium]
MTTDPARPLNEHLNEVRSRIIKSVVLVVAVIFILMPCSDTLLQAMLWPLHAYGNTLGSQGRIVFTEPAEAFMVNWNLAIYASIFISSPFILYQIWAFVAIALRPHEKRKFLAAFFVSAFLFTLGSAFGFLAVIPVALMFLLGFASDLMVPMLSIGKYVSFVSVMSLVFGLVFQLPLVMVFLTRLGILSPAYLAGKRRAIIVIIFIIAAIFTPNDGLTMFLMAIPLLLLFEAGLFFSRLTKPRMVATDNPPADSNKPV